MKPEKIIVPAVIAKTQKDLDVAVLKVKDFVKLIQLDVMDGKFVPNHSIDFDFAIPQTRCRLEAHLMVNSPEEWIEKNGEKVDALLIHIESCATPDLIIKIAKERKKQIGLVLNPETPTTRIQAYLDQIDQVLIMTVHPGFYGSTFLPEMLEKIRELRRIKPLLNIEVDGGVTLDTIGLVNEAGANMFVSGSYIMKSPDPKEAIANLKAKIGE
ncbi:MAG TPA: ribulose-phosphate 3-epimerase [Syntrophales bacterium]|nr:ribulose-phosphate 3-epimerase [Syntrophales bacterium]